MGRYLLMCVVVLWGAAVVQAADNASHDPPVVSRHKIRLAGTTLRYTATAGTLRVAAQEHAATLFYVAYTRRQGGSRPLTFVFNGGPGSSSVWLHLGALGPRQVALQDNGSALPPPVRVAANPDSWLAFSDLVCIDPVGTGFSRADGSHFFDVRADIAVIAEFIRSYLSQYQRWGAPLFVVGESYGTTRAAGLADYLQQRHGMRLSGLVLVSPVLDFMTLDTRQPALLPFCLALPSYAASARFHGRAGSAAGSLEEWLAGIEQWALSQYLVTLAAGSSAGAVARRSCAAALARMTGLEPQRVCDNQLKIPPGRFRKQLLAASGRVLGRMDARCTAHEYDRGAAHPAFDPSLDRLSGVFATGVNYYLRQELGYASPLPYEFLNPEVSRRWDWSSALPGGQGYVTMSGALAAALRDNPSLQVMVATGYYDLATPYYAAEYTIAQLPIGAAARGRIRMHRYRAGHMMYTDRTVRRQLTRDAAQFYRHATAASPTQ